MGKRVVGEGWTERPLFCLRPLPLHAAFPKMTEGVSVALLRSPTRVGVHVVSHTGAMRQARHNRMAGNGHTVGTRARVFTPNGHHTNLASIWVLIATHSVWQCQCTLWSQRELRKEWLTFPITNDSRLSWTVIPSAWEATATASAAVRAFTLRFLGAAGIVRVQHTLLAQKLTECPTKVEENLATIAGCFVCLTAWTARGWSSWLCVPLLCQQISLVRKLRACAS
jgi:hypothetical protein